MSTKVSCSALLVGAISVMAGAAEKPRVFITESGAGQATGEASVGATQGSLAFTGGTSPENREVMKAFSHRYPAVMVTADRKKADYIVRLDHEAINPTTRFVHGNKVAVFNKQQDLMYSNSTRTLGNAVKGACAAITAEDKPVTSK
jgi:hypothetical protein